LCYLFLDVTWFCRGSCKALAQGQAPPSKQFADGKSLKISIPNGWKTTTSETDRALIVTLTPEASQNFRLQITAIPLANLKPDANSPEQVKILAQQLGQSILGGAEEKEINLKEAKIDNGTAYYFQLTDKNLKAGQRKYMTQLIVGIDGAVIFMSFTSIEKDSAEEKQFFEMAKTIKLAKANRT